jgi:hypothetical protein
MTFNQFVFNWSLFFLSSAILASISLFVWWLVRKRLRDFWLPIVRVFTLPVSRLPRVILRRPPFIPFLLFLLCSLIFVVWSSAPKTKIFQEKEPGVNRVHVFVDMSPSVSAQVSMDELSQKVRQLLEEIGPKARVSFGTSHGDNIYEMTSPVEAADVLSGLGFHRGGVKIGSGVRSQLSRVGEIDQLFIVSDRDQHSWTGFQWQYLAVDGEVHHVDLDNAERREILPNVFIQDARFLSSAGSSMMEWEVDLSLGVLTAPVRGNLTASVGGDVVGSAEWEMKTGQKHNVINVSWPVSKVSPDLIDDAVEWSLDVAGDDSLAMDNKFMTPLKGKRDLVVLVGEPSGELRLEDPLVALETALKVSGYAVSRYDRWPEIRREGDGQRESFDSSGAVVTMSPGTSNLDAWCPKSLLQTRDSIKSGPLWLMPRSVGESYSPLCFCLANLGARITADMCDNQMSRGDWIDLLGAVGAKQVGGNVGEAVGSIGMMLSSADLPRNIVSFTLPLRPSPELGLSWGLFPILVKDLMFFSHTGSMNRTAESNGLSGVWPRLSDVSVAANIDESIAEQWTQIFRSTNVPIGESLMATVDTSSLPSSWGAGRSSRVSGNRAGREVEDARGWIWWLSGVILILMLLEVVWFWRSTRGQKTSAALFIFLVMMSAFQSNRAQARARLDLLAIEGQSSETFQSLSKEVASRTSLELEASPELFVKFDDEAAKSPWLWTNKPLLLADGKGRISDDARLWLKRGGIVIFDGPQPQGILENLLEPLMIGTVRPSGWMAMPPDHEFMRSFYLLNSLPTCKGRSWRIFSFDGRVAAIEAPYSNLKLLRDKASNWSCDGQVTYEQHVRIFVNLMMTAFTTDYKRDQIHLPEILKRLRVP